jgi:hypothetical protein
LKSKILFSGEIFPVNEVIKLESIFKKSSHEALCCETKGRVGARIMILDSGYFYRVLPISKIPIIVFPKPVGKTIKEFLPMHLLIILYWYCRKNTLFFFKKGWLKYPETSFCML